MYCLAPLHYLFVQHTSSNCTAVPFLVRRDGKRGCPHLCGVKGEGEAFKTQSPLNSCGRVDGNSLPYSGGGWRNSPLSSGWRRKECSNLSLVSQVQENCSSDFISSAKILSRVSSKCLTRPSQCLEGHVNRMGGLPAVLITSLKSPKRPFESPYQVLFFLGFYKALWSAWRVLVQAPYKIPYKDLNGAYMGFLECHIQGPLIAS